MSYKAKRAFKKGKRQKTLLKAPFLNALADNCLSNQSFLARVRTWRMDFLIILANGCPSASLRARRELVC